MDRKREKKGGIEENWAKKGRQKKAARRPDVRTPGEKSILGPRKEIYFRKIREEPGTSGVERTNTWSVVRG